MTRTQHRRTAAAPSRAFTVVTYNILADAYVRPRRYPRSPKWTLDPRRRGRLLLDKLAAQDADIYCLQEVEPAALEAIRGRLGGGYDVRYEQRRGRPDGAAIFVRRAAFTIERSEHLHYAAHEPGDDQVAVIAHLRRGSRRLAVACTHLRWQSERVTPEEHIGRKQLDELLDVRDAAGDDVPWILAGDLNAISESVVVKAALARGLQLSCASQRPWDTCNINGRRRKLDYLLYEPEAMTAAPGVLPRLEPDTPMPSRSEPSDHLPVSVTFTPRPTASARSGPRPRPRLAELIEEAVVELLGRLPLVLSGERVERDRSADDGFGDEL